MTPLASKRRRGSADLEFLGKQFLAKAVARPVDTLNDLIYELGLGG